MSEDSLVSEEMEEIEKGLIRNYIKHNLISLLNKIKQIYPDEITDDIYKHELDILDRYTFDINISLTQQLNLSSNDPETSEEEITPEPTSPPVQTIIQQQPEQSIIQQQPEQTISRKPKQPMEVIGKPICIARVMDLEKPITYLPTGQIIYGRRCKKTIYNNSQYCMFHTKNNPHGDFEKEPSPHMRTHFEKKASKLG
jgi:hypothetical protein